MKTFRRPLRRPLHHPVRPDRREGRLRGREGGDLRLRRLRVPVQGRGGGRQEGKRHALRTGGLEN